MIGHGSESGQTLGKKAVSIAVRRDGGERLGFGLAALAALAQALLGFIPFVGLLNLLAPLWDSKNQCWHDKMAGSVVEET